MTRRRNRAYLQRKLEVRKKSRAKNHIYYESNCVICQETFIHDRMTAMYCSQKCRNKSRSYSPQFLESMYKKANLTLRRFVRQSDGDRDFVKNNTLDISEAIDNLRAIGASQFDINAMLEKIRMDTARKRLERQKQELHRDDVVIDQDPRITSDPEAIALREQLKTGTHISSLATGNSTEDNSGIDLSHMDDDIKDIEFEFDYVLGDRQEEKKTIRLSGFRNKEIKQK